VNGSRLADEAGEALRSIYGSEEREAKMIEGIARAANDHARTSEAVAGAVTRIAEIARQTNGATQDTTSAVSYLAELAEQLRASVATFRLPEQATQGPAMLPQPDGQYPSTRDLSSLPNLGITPWADQSAAVPALPALPAPLGQMPNLGAPANGFDLGGFDLGGFDLGGAFDLGGFDRAYGGQQHNERNDAAPTPGYG